MTDLRIGLGVDAHAFADGIPLVLAGIQFDEDRGLAGHSDGDVVSHALIDALLGAAGLGDIGTLFPSEDDSLRGVSSLLLLRNAYGKVTERRLRARQRGLHPDRRASAHRGAPRRDALPARRHHGRRARPDR